MTEQKCNEIVIVWLGKGGEGICYEKYTQKENNLFKSIKKYSQNKFLKNVYNSESQWFCSFLLHIGAVQKTPDVGRREGGSSQGVRLASGRGREGLPQASADAPPAILNSLHTDFLLFLADKLQSIDKNETKNAQSE